MLDLKSIIVDIIIIDIVGVLYIVKIVKKGLDFFICATTAACSFNIIAYNRYNAWVIIEVVSYLFLAKWLCVTIRVQNERGYLTRAHM